MRPIEHVRDTDQYAPTTRVILRELSTSPDRLLDAFRSAEVEMVATTRSGRPFILTDGHRSLFVAIPGEPLKLVGKRGRLVEAQEQDFHLLARSIW